jgi:hypothetical protein
MVFWLLTREVLSLKGELEEGQFTELPDLFMYRNIEKKDEKKEEEVQEGDVQEEGDKEDDNAEENFIDEDS